MLKQVLYAGLLALAASAISGCAAPTDGSGGNGPLAAAQLGPTQLAAYSARSQYPQTQPGNSKHLAAIVSRDKATIEVFNFGDERVGDGKLWVNRSYVVPVTGIAPHSHISLRTDQLYNSVGSSLSGQAADISSVQIETNSAFENLQGPVTQ